MNEISPDIRELRIKEMISAIERVDTPELIVVEAAVSEYRQGAIQEGLVVGVPQAHAGHTESLPIRTDSVDKCVVLIYRVFDQVTDAYTYYLVHIQDGDLSANAPGAQKKDLKKSEHSSTEAILLHSQRARTNGIGLARELAYEGIETTKIIGPQSGNSLIDVTYRPADNKILVRIKSSGQVHIFSGF